MLNPMHVSHMQRTSVGSLSVSEILFLMFVWGFTEGKAVLELAGEGLGWGEKACVTGLQARLLLELQSQLMFRDMPNVVIDDQF